MTKSGIRRSGKSNLMQAYINYLKSEFEDVNIIFIDFMDLEFEETKEYHALHKYVEDRYDKEMQNNISNQDTFEREYSPLLQIKDAYPKMIIARTRHDEYQYEGIKVVDIADWLLEK